MKKIKEISIIFFSFIAGVFHYLILTTFGLYHWIRIVMTIASFCIVIGGVSMLGEQ